VAGLRLEENLQVRAERGGAGRDSVIAAAMTTRRASRERQSVAHEPIVTTCLDRGRQLLTGQ